MNTFRKREPDFRTLLLFRKRFHKELGSLLKQTIGIGLKEKIITLDHVCIDGTKLRAFAGRNSFKKPKKLKEDLEKLEEEIAQSITEGHVKGARCHCRARLWSHQVL